MFEEALRDIECAHMGIDPSRRERLVKLADEQRRNYTSADIRLAAALAKTAFECSDEPGSIPHRLFAQLLKTPTPTPGNRKIASIVFLSMGRVIRQKRASVRAAALARNLLGFATSAVPEVVKGVGMVGLAAGGLGGGALWAAQRGLTHEDQQLREQEIQRDTYSRLSAEVKAELERRKMVATPANRAAAVDYLT